MNASPCVFCAILAALFLAIPALDTRADVSEELAALKSQLKALEAKVAELEARQSAPQAVDPRWVEKLDRLPEITLDSKGINFSSPGIRHQALEIESDGKSTVPERVPEEETFKFRIGALLQPQSRNFLDTPDSTSTFLIRRARLNLEGEVMTVFDWKLQADLQSNGVNNTTNSSVQDAYIGAKGFDWLQIRAGKMKSPIGVERWQSSHARWFTDLITTTYLVPNRTVGAMLWGNVGDGVAEYYAGLFNGAPDGGSANVSSSGQNSKDFEARLAVTPLANSDLEPLKMLTLGAGVTYAPQLSGLGTYATANQQAFFQYRSSTVDSTAAKPGEQVRFVPNLQFFQGPWGLYAEAAWSTVGVSNGPESANLTNFGWQVAGSFFLTGEKNSFRAVSPRRDFQPSNGGWGALQLTARAGQLQIDSAAFPVFADPDTQASQSTTFGTGLNWLLSENIKLTLQYDFTSFRGGAPGGSDRPESNAITTQFQMYF